METVGVIGIGLVGTSLARHLQARGFGVVGTDLDAAARERLRALGGTVAESPAAVARQAGRIVLSLPTTREVGEVIDALLATDRPPRYLIDTTTGDPEATAALAGRLAARGIGFLDATISGSSRQIADRQAVFMVGGDPDAMAACRDLLDALGDRVFHLGPSGSGSRAKLASNLILGLNRAVLAEGLMFAERLGLDLDAFLAVLKASPAYSAAMDAKGRKMLDGDFTPESRMRQHAKDVRLMLEYAERLGVALPLTGVHDVLLRRAVDAGDGELDNAAIIREMRRGRTSG